jgi:hypothetical protein
VGDPRDGAEFSCGADDSVGFGIWEEDRQMSLNKRAENQRAMSKSHCEEANSF